MQVAGAGMNLSHVAVAFLCAALIGLALYVGSAIGFAELISTVTTSPLTAFVRAINTHLDPAPCTLISTLTSLHACMLVCAGAR